MFLALFSNIEFCQDHMKNLQLSMGEVLPIRRLFLTLNLVCQDAQPCTCIVLLSHNDVALFVQATLNPL